MVAGDHRTYVPVGHSFQRPLKNLLNFHLSPPRASTIFATPKSPNTPSPTRFSTFSLLRSRNRAPPGIERTLPERDGNIPFRGRTRSKVPESWACAVALVSDCGRHEILSGLSSMLGRLGFPHATCPHVVRGNAFGGGAKGTFKPLADAVGFRNQWQTCSCPAGFGFC